MRKRHQRALVLGVGVAAAVASAFISINHWDFLYAQFFLDRRLVGEWKIDFYRSRIKSGSFPSEIHFYASGRCDLEKWHSESATVTCTYDIENDKITFGSVDEAAQYRGSKKFRYEIPKVAGLILRHDAEYAYYMRD